MSATAANPSRQSLVAPLPDGPLDIVGDVHGEWEALQSLLLHLGYDAAGRHPQKRTLVFVGDLCDRGPDTPAVLDWLLPLLAQQRACAVLGNHEVNLIREDSKDGAGWAFADRIASDTPKYAPFAQATAQQRARYLHAINRWPAALEREDLRIVHAAWQASAIAQVRDFAQGAARHEYDRFEDIAEAQAASSILQAQLFQEKVLWPHDLEDASKRPPLLHAHAERELLKQRVNPLKLLTTGVEQAARSPFYAGGKWRFTERLGWWDLYDESTPVVVGHYWRRFGPPVTRQPPQPQPQPQPQTHPHSQTTDEGLFGDLAGTDWHGKRRNVFCVDFSVGARWSERRQGLRNPQNSRFRLGALRWPEKTIVLDTGETCDTTRQPD